jgi:hypothetical protein
MGRGNRAYKSAKRNKELQRLKKREEKRLRRLGGKPPEGGDVEAAPIEEGQVPETAAEPEDLLGLLDNLESEETAEEATDGSDEGSADGSAT